MHLVLVGLNHRCAPIELRERLAFRTVELPDALTRLRRDVGLREAAVLSTCNRVEIYAEVAELDGTIERLQRFLSAHGRLDLAGLKPRLYNRTGTDAVRHLFRVAGGLDSMVLGEGEILGQVRQAYELARQHGATGKVFNVLFQRALNAGKAVREQTTIGRGEASVGSVAVELSRKIFGDLRKATVLLIGAGKIGEVTLQRLAARGVERIRVTNRSFDRALQLAQRYEVIPCPLEGVGALLQDADIVISSISAPGHILTRLLIAQAMVQRAHRPLCVVDLGVPRNIEPSVGSLDNVYLFDIDDLQGLVTSQLHARREALSASQAIIDRKVDHFVVWWNAEAPHADCAPACAPVDERLALTVSQT